MDLSVFIDNVTPACNKMFFDYTSSAKWDRGTAFHHRQSGWAAWARVTKEFHELNAEDQIQVFIDQWFIPTVLGTML